VPLSLLIHRIQSPPVLARVVEGTTVLDLRAIDPADDAQVAAALKAAISG